jgi:hypothetical protein
MPTAYRTATIAAANARMQAMYHAHAVPFGYDPAGQWYDCDLFAILRLRGVCHTVYVVHNAPTNDSGDWYYHVVDMWTDGGPHTMAEISEPITSWGDALLTATRKVIIGDGEITETLTDAQADALRATERPPDLT